MAPLLQIDMSDVSRGTWAVWGVAALIVVMAAVGAGLATVELEVPAPTVFAFRGFDAVTGLCYAAIALLILHHQPSNGVGILFLGIGFVTVFFWMTSQ